MACLMPVRFLSEAELARLSSWPDEIAEDDLVTYFTLTSDDLDWLGSTVRSENRVGAAVQLCALPWLGWIPDELSACPPAAVRLLADQLQLADTMRLAGSRPTVVGKVVPGVITGRWCSTGPGGEPPGQVTASSSTPSSSLAR